ncbi:glycoside hydrolase family 3 C-terminal domain-containing protein [Aerococcaceae bacterium DSM 111021]|nr:glycoside hydrolase family 3 C-terminal domain-containing protein [Aerococcaceae bacterium DSM 111021]
MKGKNSKRIVAAIDILLIVLLVVGHYYAGRYSQVISTYLGHETTRVEVSGEEVDSEYFKSDFATQEELVAFGEEVAHEIGRESIVLLKNEEATLPLLENETNITVLGQNSVDFIYGGEGASSMDKSLATPFDEALEAAGFNINQTVLDFYISGAGSEYRKTKPNVYGEGEFAVNEAPVDLFDDALIDSFADYNDAALVVVGRSGGESSDISMETLESGSHYLELDADEIALIELAQDNFDKVVVVLNTLNPMELGSLEELNMDAAIWVGAGGKTGILAIGEVLNGTVNPSGRLTDTYAYDVFSSPAMVNYGNFNFTNVETARSTGFMTYNEDVYVGYRYYETRYEDVVSGQGNAGDFDYASEVLYPFGYGLSYTDFSYDNMELAEEDGAYTITVDINNDGEVAGKEVVQLYLQSPFTDYDVEQGIDKPAVELVGFAKTDMIEAGASETVTISVPKESLKVYDRNGEGTYIVDAGDYHFSVGDNSNDALNNILNVKGFDEEDGMTGVGNADLVSTVTVDELDTETYSVSQVTGNEIENQFDNVDMASYYDDVEYLSRTDWQETWPETYAGGELEATDDIIYGIEITRDLTDEVAEMPETGVISDEYGVLQAIDLKDVDYDDPMWNALVSQLTLDELTEFVRMGGYATVPLESINLPATVIRDGTAGLSGELVGGKIDAMAYPVELVLASTWNTDIVNQMGQGVGEDTLYNKIAGWYAPGMNLHRVPFGGRNFEYFSEDPLLSGKMSAAIVEGAQSKGAFTHAKHFVLNETDTNRIGGGIYSNEQALRELYLKPFEITVREGEGNGFMASMNRVGPIWSGAHKGLMTNTLRDEWGFKGFVATDQASFDVFSYQDIIEGLNAGTNIWLNTDANLWQFSDADLTPTTVQNIKDSAHAVLYSIVNSNAMNGIADNTSVVQVMPLWQYWLWAATIAIALLMAFVTWKVFKPAKSAEDNK